MKKLLLIALGCMSAASFAEGFTIPSGTTFVAKITTGAALVDVKAEDPMPIMAMVNLYDSKNQSDQAISVMNKTNSVLGIKLASKNIPTCNILGAGFLDAGSLRAKVRTTSISCTYPNGSTYSAQLQGWFVDYNDNLAGISVKGPKNSVQPNTDVYVVVNQTTKLTKVD